MLVPLPSSSIMALGKVRHILLIYYYEHREKYMLRRSMLRRMKAVSLISAANVETLASMLSSTETLAKSWWRIGKEAYSAGTLQFINRGYGDICV